ncbi:MAG: outer membrane beta-barrel protein [Bacteroidota bacterium]|nr:porin family protein [Ignavibacteria bacterium]HEX2960291.1 outer membrane beta-barrel protein [Ignavibacteriales bacterium]MCU7500400.1 porin family protein [Ignavibacteria bacterium]MCU7512752.1 porin family protein [Ignavibacteria bacterium]MCU7520366.1 porin family protein [Ignavibacteria bacterium]
MKSTFKVLAALLVIIMLSSMTTSAQSVNPFQKNSQVGQLGLGLGMAGIYGTSSMPPISAGFQYGIDDKISVGGLVGYASSSEDWGGWAGENWSWKYTYFLIAARGEYHFLESIKNLDGYAGLTVGYNVVSVSTPSDYFGHDYSASGSYAVIGIHGGVRYFFSPNFAVFGELGYGLGILTAGIAYKF